MKVALELQPCCKNRSGVGTYTYELVKRLNNKNSIEFYGNLFNFLGKSEVTNSIREITIPVRECKFFPYGVYRRFWNYIPISYNKLFQDKSDLNIFFNYIVPPHVKGKVMTTVYDMTYIRYPETMNEKNKNFLNRNIQKSISRCDHILTISEFSKREIMELLDIPAKMISVVHCAPGQSTHVCESQMHIKKKFGINKPYLLYVGTIEPRKNLVNLIYAFDILKRTYKIPHQLVLAGGFGWKTEQIMSVSKSSLFKDEIIYTGFISESEKNSLYVNADVFTFVSWYEGFGIPPLEAMNYGCPVVCSNAASLPEVVGNAAEIVEPESPEMIAHGIYKILSNQEYALSLREKGYIRCQQFNWDKSAKDLIKICEKLLFN